MHAVETVIANYHGQLVTKFRESSDLLLLSPCRIMCSACLWDQLRGGKI